MSLKGRAAHPKEKTKRKENPAELLPEEGYTSSQPIDEGAE